MRMIIITASLSLLTLIDSLHAGSWLLADKHKLAGAAAGSGGRLVQLENPLEQTTNLNVGEENILELPIGWKNCGKPDDLFKLRSFTISPDPPRRSQVLTIQVVGTLLESLNGGHVNYTVQLGVVPIPIVQDSINLCETLKMEPNLPHCPLESGEWNVTHKVEIPREVPFGHYSIQASGWTDDNRQVFCVEGTTIISLLQQQQEELSSLSPSNQSIDQGEGEGSAELTNHHHHNQLDDGDWNHQVEFTGKV